MTGSLSATLDVPASGSVRIDQIDDFEVEVGTVTLSAASPFLAAVESYGVFLDELFPGLAGATLNALVDQEVAKALRGNSLDRDIKEAINAALGPVAQVESAVNVGSAMVDYSVALSAATTSESKDRLRSQWDVDFSTNRADAACAAGLRRSNYMVPFNTQTTNDFDVLVPYKKLTDLMVTIGKTGDLCAPFSWSGSTLEVKPAGEFTITPVVIPFLPVFNVFKFSVPVKVEAAINPLTSGFISATLEITAALVPTCHGVDVRPSFVNLANPTGTIRRSVAGTVTTLDATRFINTYKAPAEAAILAAISPSYNIAPGTFAIPGTGYSLRGGQVLWGEREVTFGVDVIAGTCD